MGADHSSLTFERGNGIALPWRSERERLDSQNRADENFMRRHAQQLGSPRVCSVHQQTVAPDADGHAPLS